MNARPVFGWSNKRGTVVVLDDGTVLERVGDGWVEAAPLPRTPRAAGPWHPQVGGHWVGVQGFTGLPINPDGTVCR